MTRYTIKHTKVVAIQEQPPRPKNVITVLVIKKFCSVRASGVHLIKNDCELCK